MRNKTIVYIYDLLLRSHFEESDSGKYGVVIEALTSDIKVAVCEYVYGCAILALKDKGVNCENELYLGSLLNGILWPKYCLDKAYEYAMFYNKEVSQAICR